MRDAWWVAIWFCIWSLGVSAWAQEQARSGGIFADGFESGDACAWTLEGCETPPPVVASPCGLNAEVVRHEPPYRCESYATPQGESWRYEFTAVCSDGRRVSTFGELGLAPNECTEVRR